jgi:hypothetical protein
MNFLYLKTSHHRRNEEISHFSECVLRSFLPHWISFEQGACVGRYVTGNSEVTIDSLSVPPEDFARALDQI